MTTQYKRNHKKALKTSKGRNSHDMVGEDKIEIFCQSFRNGSLLFKLRYKRDVEKEIRIKRAQRD